MSISYKMAVEEAGVLIAEFRYDTLFEGPKAVEVMKEQLDFSSLLLSRMFPYVDPSAAWSDIKQVADRELEEMENA